MAKYVLSGVLVPLVAIQLAVLVQRTGNVLPRGALGELPPFLYVMFTCWLLVCASMFWLSVSLKRVRLADGALLVSNYIREWRVPLGLIESVSQNCWLKPRPIAIRLKADVGCGTTVKFMPPAQYFRFVFWREDDVVHELREMAGSAQLRDSAARLRM